MKTIVYDLTCIRFLILICPSTLVGCMGNYKKLLEM